MKTCCFHDGPRNCPAPGVAQVNGGPWYCHWHNPHNKFVDNRRILDDLIQNGVPRMKDWRDEIVDLAMHGLTPEEARKQVFKTMTPPIPQAREPGSDDELPEAP